MAASKVGKSHVEENLTTPTLRDVEAECEISYYYSKTPRELLRYQAYPLPPD